MPNGWLCHEPRSPHHRVALHPAGGTGRPGHLRRVSPAPMDELGGVAGERRRGSRDAALPQSAALRSMQWRGLLVQGAVEAMNGHRPLIAVEDPPDFGTERTNRYRVIDTARNRTVATLALRYSHVQNRAVWRWWIGVPQSGGFQAVPPSGEAETRDEALAAIRAAWDVYPALERWPPFGAGCWPSFRPEHWRGDDVGPGQGPWLPGREPKGWQPH